MSEAQVARLYDALHKLESRFRAGSVYPVHKRLKFDIPDVSDIYDWISIQVGLPDHGAILDAGCGVGFGAVRMAERFSGSVTGISVSNREIVAARQAAKASPAGQRLEFKLSSFDSQPSCAYDLITAVESLKHSSDLRATLLSLCTALRPGGRLVIVEDLYCGPATHVDAEKLAAFWGLRALYTESDYLSALPLTDCRAVDLTACVLRSGAVRQLGSRFFAATLARLGGQSARTAARAFTGGVHLERLYLAGLVSYTALIVEAPGHAVSG